MVRVRTRREIEHIAESAQIVADTLDMLSTKATIGVSLLELDALAEEFIRSRNARPAFKGYMGFPSKSNLDMLLFCISLKISSITPCKPCDKIVPHKIYN